MQVARRLEQIGAYLFADLDRKQAELAARGVDVINLGVGDPDLPTPPHIIDALMEGATDARSHRYPPYSGTQEFKAAAARWDQRPFGVTATPEFCREAVQFARTYNLILAHDNPYSEIAYDGYRAPSVLEIPGAKEVAIEFHSLSKTYCMTGWRVGFVVGNAAAVSALAKIKTNVDSGVFRAVQQAGIAALDGPQQFLPEQLRLYQARRDRTIRTLRSLGWQAPDLRATFYIWLPVPDGASGAQFATSVLERTGVVVTPGAGYGAQGEKYVRISLTIADDRLDEALRRLTGAFGRAPRNMAEGSRSAPPAR